MLDSPSRHRSAKLFVLCIGGIFPTNSSTAQHGDLFVGHSPPDPDPPNGVECPTLEPLKLFVADNTTVGGAIPPGGGTPIDPGELIDLQPVAFNATLADPARGGFVFARNEPGLNFISPGNPCHGMSTAFTGGRFFQTFLERVHFSDGVNFAMTRNVTPILVEDGHDWQFGDSQTGGHMHPFFLAHRGGAYTAEFQISASAGFTPSDPFTLRFSTHPECHKAHPLNLTPHFNADVIDSNLSDDPTPFDRPDRSWLLDGLYGSNRGIPIDGKLDIFQLGGPSGETLQGSLTNCLFDDGFLSTAATVDLSQSGESGLYLSAELLLAAAGDFTCLSGQQCDHLTVRIVYDSGGDQVVNIRRLALPVEIDPVYVPLNDWRVESSPPPLLAVGPSGRREGGGFERSDGRGIDTTVTPTDLFYFQRVTFPVDPARVVQVMEIEDYTGSDNVGVFAITLLAEAVCCDGDADGDGDVDLTDYGAFSDCSLTKFAPDCDVFDCDQDGDVDILDFGRFQVFTTGTDD